MTLTPQRRLDREQRLEESNRPATAEITIAYPLAGSGATLRLYNTHDTEQNRWSLTDPGTAGAPNNPNGVYRGKITHGANTDGLKEAAEWRIIRAGFTYAPGAQWNPYLGSPTEQRGRAEWAPFTPPGHTPYMMRVALAPSAGYLAYVARRFGPLPTLPTLPGLTITPRTQRGWWDIERADGERFTLTWFPQVNGDLWWLRGEPPLGRLNTSGPDPKKLLATL